MEQVKSFVRRLHVPGAVEEKALEYCRLAEVKCSSASRGAISPSCLAVVCIDLACVQLGEPFDKKACQRLSGVSSKGYLSVHQTVEKLLNVSSQVSLRDLAVRFGCLEAEPLAETLLENYKASVEKKYTAAQKASLDLTKTLYSVAALYCACKLLKIRCEKGKFQASSTSTKQVFQNVLEEMNRSAPKNIDEFKSRKRKHAKTVSVGEEERHHGEDASGEGGKEEMGDGGGVKRNRETMENRIQSNPKSQVYLEWKENTLRLAREKLVELES